MAQNASDATVDLDVVDHASRRHSSAGVHATLRVLDLLAAGPPRQLSELARELHLPKSTLHRICLVLLQRGWAVRDKEGRYSLGIRAIRLGARSEELPIVVAFRTVAAGLLARHDETVALAVLDGDESLFIAIEETSHPVRLVTHVGSKSPGFSSASGRVVLASHPRHAVDAMFGGRPLVTPTGRRLNGVAELHEILEKVRAAGYAESVEEMAVGLYAVSAPVTNDSGATLAALTVLAPTSRVSPERQHVLRHDLVDAGRLLSNLVGWLPTVTGDSAAPVSAPTRSDRGIVA